MLYNLSHIGAITEECLWKADVDLYCQWNQPISCRAWTAEKSICLPLNGRGICSETVMICNIFLFSLSLLLLLLLLLPLLLHPQGHDQEVNPAVPPQAVWGGGKPSSPPPSPPPHSGKEPSLRHAILWEDCSAHATTHQ